MQARDSYAHRPTAISADIKAARTLTGDGGRVVAVVEPSGWARTAAMSPRGRRRGRAPAGPLLADSPISLADVETIARAITAHGTRVRQVPDIGEPARGAYGAARGSDAVLVMGTSHVTEVVQVLLDSLRLATLAVA